MNILKLILVASIMLPSAMLIGQDEIKTKIKTLDNQAIRFISDQNTNKDKNNIIYDIEKVWQNVERYDLPVAEIDMKEATNTESGLAILIPQNHRYPGTEVMDKKNDSAEITQKQIFKILGFLTEQYGADLIMNEGDIYGQDAEGKVAKTRERQAIRESFASLITELKTKTEKDNILQPEEKTLLEKSEKLLAYIDREIALGGASYMIASQNNNVHLVGAENIETYNKCSELVRDYTYQKDQLATCKTNGGNLAKASDLKSMIGTGNLASLLNSLQKKYDEGELIPVTLLEKFQNMKSDDISFESAVARVRESASVSGDEDYQGLLDKMILVYEQINTQDIDKTTAPSRSQNPYSDIEDVNTLENMIAESEEKIEDMIIVQRNEETAVNFENALKDENKQIGIIQFGAGHEEGLVEELNKKGIDVLVVKPDEVARREEASDKTVPDENATNNDKLSIIKELLENN